MKKRIFLVLLLALIPAAARAQEKTLYDISSDMLFLVEMHAACAEQGGACTAEDLHALKAGAKKSLRDLVRLVWSGNRSRMMFTFAQVQSLRLRAAAAKARLAHAEAFDGACNQAVNYFNQVVMGLSSLLLYLNPFALYLAIGWAGLAAVVQDFINLVTFTVWSLLMTIALSPTCLFWWL